MLSWLHHGYISPVLDLKSASSVVGDHPQLISNLDMSLSKSGFNTITSNSKIQNNEFIIWTPTVSGKYTVTISAKSIDTLADKFEGGQTFALASTIPITQANHPPVATDKTITAYAGEITLIDVTDGITDSDTGDTSFTVQGVDTRKTTDAVIDLGDTFVTFRPTSTKALYQTEFYYQIKDQNNGYDIGKVTVNVEPPKDHNVFVAGDDVATTKQNESITISVTNNDPKIDKQKPVSITTINIGSSNGAAVISGTDKNTITYTPPTNFVGQKTFTYTASHDSQTSVATVTVYMIKDYPSGNYLYVLTSGGLAIYDTSNPDTKFTVSPSSLYTNPTNSNLNSAQRITFDDSGDYFYISDSSAKKIHRFYATGKYDQTIWTGTGSDKPYGLAYGGSNLRLYAAIDGADKIIKFQNSDDTAVSNFVTSSITKPKGPLMFGPNSQDLQLADWGPNSIKTISSSGSTVTSTITGFDEPVFAISSNYYYVANHDDTSNKIYRYSYPAGTASPSSGNSGADFITYGNDLEEPIAITVGPDGKIYVADEEEEGVFRFTSSGGNAGKSDASSFNPASWLDSISNIRDVIVHAPPVTNTPPQANDDVVQITEDSLPVVISPIQNDFDENKSTLSISTSTVNDGAATTSGGSIVVDNNSITYTVTPNFNGEDEFGYTLTDKYGETSTAKIKLVIKPVNDIPVAITQSASTDEDVAKVITLTASDVDTVFGDTLQTLQFEITSNPTHGTFSSLAPISESAQRAKITYVPNQNYHGSDSFTFKVNDGTGYSNAATVSITISPVNDTPVLSVVSPKVIQPGNPVSLAVYATDVDSTSLSYSLTAGTSGAVPTGAAIVSSTGVFTWTPTASQKGTHTFDVIVSDGTSTSSQTISIIVASTPIAPTGLISISNTIDSVALSWTAPTDDGGSTIIDYTIQYKKSVDSEWITFDDGVNIGTTVTVTGLEQSTPYDFRVSAVNGVNTGDSSDVISATLVPITEIIDSTGDGAGNTLSYPQGITVDSSNNIYVTGFDTKNVFKITPAGVKTEIIDSTGDGAGNTLNAPDGMVVDSLGNVYVTGYYSDNVFKITPAGVKTEIIDSTGDGAGNTLNGVWTLTVDSLDDVYVAGRHSDNVFKITVPGTCSTSGTACTITEIIDSTGDGAGNSLDAPWKIVIDSSDNVYVTGGYSDNAFKIPVSSP